MFLTTHSGSFSFRISLSISCCNLLIPPPRRPITSSISSKWNPGRFSLVSNANCWYLFNFSWYFSSVFCSLGQAMSTSQMRFPTLSSSVWCGLLTLYFPCLYSNSHTNLNLSSSIPFPFTHCCWCHGVPSCVIPCCFPYCTASTISALLCLLTYPVPANTVHPAKKCPHNLSTQSAQYLLLLLQLAHYPTKDVGRGLGIPPGKAATDIAHFRELVGKRNFTINMDFKKHPRASPYSPNLSSQEGVRDLQPFKVPESTPRCVYPVWP